MTESLLIAVHAFASRVSSMQYLFIKIIYSNKVLCTHIQY